MAVSSSQLGNLATVNIQGALLPISRDNCIKYAKLHGFHYILFVDSDMRFPRDGLLRLLKHGKEIVGCNAAVKGEDRPVKTHDINGIDLMDIPDTLAEVDGIGMAFTLIKLDIFKHLSIPFYYIDYSEDGKSHWGEDMSFCADIRTFGYKIYCDQDLSEEIGHIGEFEYKLKKRHK